MSKGISKEQIVHVTLELIKDREDIRSVNLREIARILGCAHTNLYNYYKDFDRILWDVLDVILEKSLEHMTAYIGQIGDYNLKLEHFFKRFIEFYLENIGWFRLSWFEKLKGDRPQKNIDMTTHTVEVFCGILTDIFQRIYGIILTMDEAKYVLHNVHCYLHGEVSIFIAGKGLIVEEAGFKKYVANECVKIAGLLANSVKQGEWSDGPVQ